MKRSLLLLPIILFAVSCEDKKEGQRPQNLKNKSLLLRDSVDKGDIEAVKKQLADGADVNVGNPLNVAIESRSTGRKEIVELLLAKGADVNAKNDRGWTPAESLKRTAGAMMLVGATDEAKAANNEIAALLRQHGAKTDADFKHWFPTQKKSPPSKESAKIIEAAIRRAAKKPTGELTKADLEKVTFLDFSFNQHQLTDVKGLENLTKLEELHLARNQLTSVKGLENLTKLTNLSLQFNKLTDVKGLEKLTQLTYLSLYDNLALTKAQIDQLQKALPKCYIGSNPKK